MLLAPKRRKFRKQMVKEIKGKSSRWNTLAFGEFWIKAITSWYLSSKEIEAARKVVVRHIKKVGKLWIRVFPDVPFTKKGLEMPMGSGKGDVDIYKSRVKKGRILLEVSWLTKEQADKVLTSAGKKLSVQCRVAYKWELK